MPPPEKLWILSQGRGFGREDRCEHGGGTQRESSTLVRKHPDFHFGSDTEGKVTAQQSSKLSKHFANMCSIPSNVGTEMEIQKAEPGKKIP